MDDDNVDMQYAPPTNQTTSPIPVPRNPLSEASPNSMQMPNTRCPQQMGLWSGSHQPAYNMNSSMYGPPGMQPFPHGGSNGSHIPNYLPPYWGQSQDPRLQTQAQNNPYTSYQTSQESPSGRPFLPMPIGSNPAWSARRPNDFRNMTMYPEQNSIANQNSNAQGMNSMGNGGADPSREQGNTPL